MSSVAAGLRYYRRRHVAVAAAVAVASAALTGALVTGTSVRQSLEDLATARLGHIAFALTAPYDLEPTLAGRIEAAAGDVHITPALVVEGAIARDGGGRAGGVTVVVAGDDFAALFREVATPSTTGNLPWVDLSPRLAADLSATPGDEVLVTLPRAHDVPRSSLLGRKDETATMVRARVRAVLTERGRGGFALGAVADRPRTAFLAPIAVADRVNTLLLAVAGDGGSSPITATHLDDALTAAVSLDDLALSVTNTADHVAITSRRVFLAPEVVNIVAGEASALGAAFEPISTYLTTSLRRGDKSIPYSTITAIDPHPALDAPRLRLAAGGLAPALAAGQILLDAWSADDLEARVGDAIELEYLVAGDGEALAERRATLVVAGIVAKHGLAAEATLAPRFPGLDDAPTIAAWNPPFPFDLARIRPHDEEYWDTYRAAPKAFVSLAQGLALWDSRYGAITSLRLGLPPGMDGERIALALARRLREEPVVRAPSGLEFRAVRQNNIAAGARSSEITSLFLGFSSFVILAAALLVGLVSGMATRERAAEIGLHLALGFPRSRIRARLRGEGIVSTLAGAVAGVGLGLAWAGVLLEALGGRWRAAVGTSALTLHAGALDLALGLVVAIAISLAAIELALRRVMRVAPAPLLGGDGSVRRERTTAKSRVVVVVALAVTATLGGLALRADELEPALFFALGASLLVLFLTGISRWLGASPLDLGGGSIARLALGGAGRDPARSVVLVSLVAAASFVLVAVGLGRQVPNASAAGGFDTIATAAPPLHRALDRADGRFELGFGDDDETLLSDTTIVPFAVKPGDDVSCLNLYAANDPRVIGVPAMLGRHAKFEFHAALERRDDPWRLLEQDLGPGIVPAIADAETARWILHLGLGDELTMRDSRGQPLRLRLVATLAGGLFQSELLIGQQAFLDHFPTHDGHAMFLIATPEARRDAVRQLLLDRVPGLDLERSEDRIARFLAVANTWLQTFAMIGGLGLLLGVAGVAVITRRNVDERRRELAAMRAFGFSGRRLTAIVATESAALVSLGLAIGAISASVAALPHLLSRAAFPALPTVVFLLVLVLAVGVAAAALAARSALRAPLLPALRGD